jgi:tetratricopeptide (TPR) repeat protein
MNLIKSILTGAMLFCLFCLPVNASEKNQKDDMPFALRVVLNDAYKHFDSQEYKKAIETLDKFRGENKSGSDHYLIDFSLGNAWLYMNNPSKAVSFYESAIFKNKDFSAAWLNLARCRYDLSQFGKAAEAFEKGYETSSPKEGEILYYAAASYFTANNASKSIEIMERLFGNHPDDIKLEKKIQWQEAILYQYLSMNMQKKALRLAGQLTETYPLEPKWWKALAHIHLSEDRYQEALAAMTIYGYLQPYNEKEKKLMAELSLMAGIPAKAVSYYESLHAQTSESSIIVKIVQSYQMMNQPQQALKWAEKGLMQTKSSELMMQKATILYELREFDKSMQAFESIVKEKNGDIGLAWLMIGFAAAQSDDLNKARIAFKNASQFERHQKTALSQLEQIKKVKRSESG